ncbi:MAG: HNH endonuclease [Alphaproteobacteria bacterium]|nr:HNH endonuclease [Alphaproteobacteria bacterium]MDA7982991.1 HNH endonuclease [Alphaproteobacteria bacterium]MDA7988225.1 HNH endonuclease [Alphaproteobacteria bacterium]MDA8008965.1 HNH endonuclease [Alphaproteobacteria bacterium]MDA8030400.1 HNH endonuclease [Alphaproteobacteria bacterium]
MTNRTAKTEAAKGKAPEQPDRNAASLQKLPNRTLFTADNLKVLNGIEDNTFDLIYLDPPFNSNRNYAGTGASSEAEFDDIWRLDDWEEEYLQSIKDTEPGIYKIIEAVGESGGESDKAFLLYMSVRLLELHRVLKSTGTIYLHIDPTMSHSLKLVMDAIYGKDNFLNEIIWHYTGGGRTNTSFSKKHDVILRYAKSKGRETFNADAVRVPYDDTSGYAKTGIKAKSGKIYKPNPLGKVVDSVWDIPIINPMAKERTGYPTQKPQVLLERIISASTNKGDLILDPFCGCGTACVAAENLGRKWIGIDVSKETPKILKKLMKATLLSEVAKLPTIHPHDGNKMNFRAKRFSPNIRKILYEAQEGICKGCKRKSELRDMDIDHIVPRSKGGENSDKNAQLLCHSCNNLKGAGTMAQLRAKLRERGWLYE